MKRAIAREERERARTMEEQKRMTDRFASTLVIAASIIAAVRVCHGRGRGFEPRRPRHSFQKTYLESAETKEGAKGHRFVSLLCPFA